MDMPEYQAACEKRGISIIDLIATLEVFPENMSIVVATPKGDEPGVSLHSWRGAYYLPALQPGTGAATVGELLTELRAARDGKIYYGWKGGDFVLSPISPIRLSASGNAENAQVVGVAVSQGVLWIQGHEEISSYDD